MELNEIKDLFIVDFGAPCPLLLATDKAVKLLFYGSKDIRSDLLYNERVVELNFKFCSFSALGPPNEEGLVGHPYFQFGLDTGGFYEILNSDLIKEISSYSRYHPRYNLNAYDSSRHFVLPFKEQLFECIADDFEVNEYDKSFYESSLFVLKQMYKIN